MQIIFFTDIGLKLLILITEFWVVFDKIKFVVKIYFKTNNQIILC